MFILKFSPGLKQLQEYRGQNQVLGKFFYNFHVSLHYLVQVGAPGHGRDQSSPRQDMGLVTNGTRG